ncbi:MAG: GTPase Era [Candidatus Acidiferrales bacterium]
MSFRSGYVTLLGRPNTGKSTLLNTLVGEKVAIVSSRPQTTRTRIQAVLHREDAQVVFLDTPGVHNPRTRMNQEMMRAVRDALEGVDLLLVLVDASRPTNEEDDMTVEIARKFAGPSFLLLNKIDVIQKQALLPLIERFRRLHDFREFIPVSARRGENLELLERKIVEYLPEGPALFPEDTCTDQPLRFLAAEIIREKILHETREEVPYATTVVIEQFEEPPHPSEPGSPRHSSESPGRLGAGLTRIRAVILVEREGQKGILIGAQGQRLKKVGQEAREELEALLGCRIFLELFVKAQPDWRQHPGVERLIDWRKEFQE